MKRLMFAVKIIIFTAVFLTLLVCVSYIVRPQSEMKTRFAGFYAEPKNSIDVVVIGSSPVPPLFAAPLIWNEHGITLYPVATNSQPTNGIKYLLKEVQKRQDDCLFIIDVSLFMAEPKSLLTEPNIRNIVDNMKYSANRFNAINEMVSDSKESLDYYFDISKYHSVITKNEFSFDAFRYFDFSVPSEYKGYFFVDAVEPFEPVDVSGISGIKPIPQESEAVLNDLIEYIKSQQLEALFVISPYIVSEERKMQHNYLANFIEDHGFTFIDFNDLTKEMGIDYSTDLYNRNHLNLAGGEKFSLYLGVYLENNYEFADKRGNKDYTSWDEAFLVWSEQAVTTKVNIDDNAQRLSGIKR